MNLMDNIKIDKRSNSPIYDQISMSLYDLITSGELRDNTILPEPQLLAHHLGIDPFEVLNAYQILIDNHFIKKIELQYVVSYFQVNHDIFSLSESLFDSISKTQKEAHHALISAKEIKPKPEFFEKSKYHPSEKIYEIKRVFYVDQLPIFISSTYLSLTRIPNFKDIFKDDMLFIPFYKTYFKLENSKSTRRIKIINLSKEDAHILGELEGTASYFTSYHYYDDLGELFSYAEVVTSSHFGFTINIDI